jgi:hypothetical protein
MSDGQQRPLHYRYKIVPKDSLNSFKPKELEPNLDRLSLRPGQFGAVFHQKYSQIPTCDWCKVVWEVGFLYFPLGYMCVQTVSLLASLPKKHFSPNKKFILIMIYVIAIFNPIFNVFGCTVLP